MSNSPTPHNHTPSASSTTDAMPPTLTEASLLAQHDNDPASALSYIVARYNDLVRTNATLHREKQAAEKAAQRSAVENQQLWRSFKLIGSGSSSSGAGSAGAGGSGGDGRMSSSSPRPTATRQNSEGLSNNSSATSTPRQYPSATPLRRGLSHDLPTPSLPTSTSTNALQTRSGGDSSTSSSSIPFPPSSTRASHRDFTTNSLTAPSPTFTTSPSMPSFRSKTATPPPTSSQHMSRSASHSSLRKAASLDLGRNSTSAALAGVEILEPPSGSSRGLTSPRVDVYANSSGLNPFSSASATSRIPTSASMPLIPTTDRSPFASDSSGGAQDAQQQQQPQSYSGPSYLTGGNGSPNNLLPSLTPISPFQVSHDYDSTPSSSPRPTPSPTSSSIAGGQLHPNDPSRRVRSSSNNSASSQSSGGQDDRSGGGAAGVDKLSPVPEATPPMGLFNMTPEEYSTMGPSFHPNAHPGVEASGDLPPPSYQPMSFASQHAHLRSPGVGSSSSGPASATGGHEQTLSTQQQYQTPHSAHSSPQPKARPTLTPSILPFTTVRVAGSTIKQSDKGKDVVSFHIDVRLSVPAQASPDKEGIEASWRVEKIYPEVQALDAAVRSRASKQEGKKLASLPDKSLFKDHAPHRSDQRKVMVEGYIQNLVRIDLRDPAPVVAFFNSNVVQEAAKQAPSAGQMEGWLTKRGRSFGAWQTRYYMLQGETLSYYETRDGPRLGEIPLHNAAIGRQSSKVADVGDETYLHAFLIRTTKAKDDRDQDTDHILCAESDDLRDAWIDALTSLQSGRAHPRPNGGSFSIDRERELSNTASNGRVSPEDSRRLQHIHQQQQTHTRNRSGSLGGQQEDSIDPRSTPRRPSTSDIPPSMSLPGNLDLMARQPEPRSRSATSDRPNKLQPPPARREIDSRSGKISDRPGTPDRRPSDGNPKLVASQVSGPMNAAPLPSGYDFKKSERAKKTKSSFWNFSRNAVTPEIKPVVAPPSRPVFGTPLKEAVAISRIRPGLELPAVVYRCVEYLEAKNAESEEGIFRLSGSANVIRLLKERFNAEGDVRLLESAEYYDPHAIAGLLKLYLRELPEHLLTRQLHPEFVQVIELRDRKDKVNALGRLVARLPIEEYTLFRFFFAHLCVIAQNAEVSKMNLRNLGIVFSPTLAIPAPLFTLLLAEFDLVFAVENGVSRPIMMEEPPVDTQADISRREGERRTRPNSEIYESSGAAKLMEEDLRGVRLQEHDEENEPELDRTDLSPTELDEPRHIQDSFLALPSTPTQSSSPAGSSPRTPNFRGLPASPRPGQTFASSQAA